MLKFQSSNMIFIIVSLLLIASNATAESKLTRESFPNGFIFGTSSSAYQYEGAAFEDGKSASIWDTFAHTPGHVVGDETADIAEDQYHRYKEDVKIMKEIGMDAYRFSISWSRLIPNGRGEVNPLGVQYYNNLINELLQNGIKPFVTLYHFDLPQTLQDEYEGWISPLIVNDFANFAEVCFQLFGDRVKNWITINEPNLYTVSTHDMPAFPPCRCSAEISSDCQGGDSTTEPYLAMHNMILCHLAAAELYNSKFKEEQKGAVGIVLSAPWYEPLTETSNDLAAVDRQLDFWLAWFLDPFFYGHYPLSMRNTAGTRLPEFTKEESQRLKNLKPDFIGLNHYTTNYVYAIPETNVPYSFLRDISVNRTAYKNGIAIGSLTAMQAAPLEEDCVVPRGIRHIVLHLTSRYNSTDIYITENGLAQSASSIVDPIHDQERVDFHRSYLQELSLAISEGANVKGYFAWSLMDNFEFRVGYTVAYGLVYVDRENGLKRIPNSSAKWFHSFLVPNNDALITLSNLSLTQINVKIGNIKNDVHKQSS